MRSVSAIGILSLSLLALPAWAADPEEAGLSMGIRNSALPMKAEIELVLPTEAYFDQVKSMLAGFHFQTCGRDGKHWKIVAQRIYAVPDLPLLARLVDELAAVKLRYGRPLHDSVKATGIHRPLS